MSRSAVMFSGLAFAGLAVLAYQLFGWQADGWVLLFAGVAHLAIVLRFYPRLDAFLVGFHYFIALAALGGVAAILRDLVGPAPRYGSVLLALLRDQWSEPLSLGILAGYVLLVTAIILLAIGIFSWLMYRRWPQRQELLTGLFVSSILNIPCDFALVDELSQVAVLDPEKSREFVFAVGLRSLDFPLIMHGLVLLVLAGISWCGRASRRQYGTDLDPTAG